MNYREVREVLKKYWDGESSLEEEQQLKEFFSAPAEDLPEDLKSDAALFQFYEKEGSQSAEDIPLPWDSIPEMEIRHGNRFIELMKQSWKYAALFILILASVWVLRQGAKTTPVATTQQDTFRDPAKAMEATQQALQILAANLNKGKKQMEKIALFNQAEELVKQNK